MYLYMYHFWPNTIFLPLGENLTLVFIIYDTSYEMRIRTGNHSTGNISVGGKVALVTVTPGPHAPFTNPIVITFERTKVKRPSCLWRFFNAVFWTKKGRDVDNVISTSYQRCLTNVCSTSINWRAFHVESSNFILTLYQRGFTNVESTSILFACSIFCQRL